MTIENALQGIYPNRVIDKPVHLGSKLFLDMNRENLARNWIRYDVYRSDTREYVFMFRPDGVVYARTGIDLTNHEKRVITKIISMWRDNMRPDWKTWESMRARSTKYATLVPVTHNTL